MSVEILIILTLNFIISLIGTLAYSVRIVAVRTGKIAISFSLFNILTLVSRMAVTFQAPLLVNYVETHLSSNNILSIFNLIIIISGIASFCGALLIPTFQKIFYKGVESFSIDRSMSKLILHSFSKSGVRYIKDSITPPKKETVTKFNFKALPIKIIIYNLIAVAMLTVGAFAPIYAGAIAPKFRATCITLSSVVNGVATIFMLIYIDPQLSIMTDDLMDGKCSESNFKACIVSMVGTKTVGTILALPLLLPVSYGIVLISQTMSRLLH